jgi:hypothetical protein
MERVLMMGEIAFDPSGTPCASRAAGGRGVRWHLGSIGAAVAAAQHAGPSGRADPITPTCIGKENIVERNPRSPFPLTTKGAGTKAGGV